MSLSDKIWIDNSNPNYLNIEQINAENVKKFIQDLKTQVKMGIYKGDFNSLVDELAGARLTQNSNNEEGKDGK